MAKYSLSTLSEEQSFFSDYFLTGIRSATEGFRFCHLMNQYLGLNLRRVLELDIPIVSAGKRKKSERTLFDEYFKEESQPEPYYFPVYKEDIPFSECSYFLYDNRCKERLLIPEKKEIDFFLLIPYSCKLQPHEWMDAFAGMNEIEWARMIEINSLGSKVNFIF
jgi:hypothetical protein